MIVNTWRLFVEWKLTPGVYVSFVSRYCQQAIIIS